MNDVVLSKVCSRCKQVKLVTDFRKQKHKSSDGLAHQCKMCADEGSEKWRQRNLDKRREQSRLLMATTQLRVNEWKREKGCSCCDENEPVCLDLHHLDPTTKEDHPSMFIRYSWEKFMKEANKCIVVCRNCHAKIHAGIISL